MERSSLRTSFFHIGETNEIIKVLVASTLLVAAANANDVMQKSMSIMEK